MYRKCEKKQCVPYVSCFPSLSLLFIEISHLYNTLPTPSVKLKNKYKYQKSPSLR